MIELKWRRLLVVPTQCKSESYQSESMVTLQKFPALLLLFVN